LTCPRVVCVNAGYVVLLDPYIRGVTRIVDFEVLRIVVLDERRCVDDLKSVFGRER